MADRPPGSCGSRRDDPCIRHRRHATWRPRDEEAAEIRAARLDANTPMERLLCVMRAAMRQHAEARTAAQRRKERVPWGVRHSLLCAAQSTTEAERVRHQREAHRALAQASAERRRAATRGVAARGGNVLPKVALHDIRGLRTQEGAIVSDSGEVFAQFWQHFATTWGCGGTMGMDSVAMAEAAFGAAAPEWDEERVRDVVGGLRRQHQVVPMGICGHALRLVAEVCPAAVTAAVLQLATSRQQMAECVVDGLALGKRSAEPSVQQVRMLLPQGFSSQSLMYF